MGCNRSKESWMRYKTEWFEPDKSDCETKNNSQEVSDLRLRRRRNGRQDIEDEKESRDQ